MRVKQIMSTDVVSMSPQTAVLDAVEVMVARDIGFMPVVAKHGSREELTGVITDRDILIRALNTRRRFARLTLEDCMTDAAVACQPDDTIDLALHLMAEGQLRRLPVINEFNEVIGVITLGDIIRNEAATGRQVTSVLRRIHAHKPELPRKARKAAA